ncbi:glycosyltransferase family 39 protein [Pantanalinema rosaneae CENA516]|uniref:glycosyltransferase family 39 protein n=1 Tax=Pantanalinema rosaneae TaxID=1620701 RepID=UPI003D6F384E
MKVGQHYLVLVSILLTGMALRFWNLDAKPIWLDEVMTALFSLGRSYNDVPLESLFSLTQLDQLFALQPQTTCAQIATTVSEQSVHPPLFFCWLHRWLVWIDGLSTSWLWKLRAFPALIGVMVIAAMYALNTTLFFPRAGLLGAAVMAVSPFAVYLSQEARHYTLPMLLVILALLGLYQLHLDLLHRQFRPLVWLGWIAVNSLGFYVHYFFLLAVVAQVGTLILYGLGQPPLQLSLKRSLGNADRPPPFKRRMHSWFTRLPVIAPPGSPLTRYQWTAIALATTGIGLTYVPWLPTLFQHSDRPETHWINFSESLIERLTALVQLPLGWIPMVIALPVERQPLEMTIFTSAIMVLFVLWLARYASGKLKRLWQLPETGLATWMLLTFISLVLLEFVVIVMVLGKDITQVPRYHFIYFPAVCALLGACLSGATRHDRQTIVTMLVVGILSSSLVVTNLTFQKPYSPELVAEHMSLVPPIPRLISVGYSNYQDVALGLSIANTLHDRTTRQTNAPSNDSLIFLSRSQTYRHVWQELSRLSPPVPFPFDLWVVGRGMKRKGYPPALTLPDRDTVAKPCFRDEAHYYRQGVPYQLYRCLP